MKRNYLKFILFAALILIAFFVLENLNQRFWLNDFKVYYDAAHAFLNDSPVYGVNFSLGSGNYKYSPFVLFEFIPFTFFSFNVAAVLFYFLLTCIIIVSFVFCWKMVCSYVFQDEIKSPNTFLAIMFVCTLNNIQRELHLGNINFIMVTMLIFAMFLMIKQKYIYAGIFLAMVIITKPFFVLLLLLLVLRRQYIALASFAVSLILFLLAPILFVGMQQNILLHKEWIYTMILHADSFPSNTTFDQLIRIHIWQEAPSIFQYIVIVVACILFSALSIFNQLKENKLKEKEKLVASNFIIEWFVMIALMPNLFRTDWQHFLMTFPLLMVLLRSIWKEKNYWLVAAFVVLAFFYGGNTEELIGDTISDYLIQSGSIGIANIFIIAFSLVMYFVSTKKSNLVLFR